jgi:hypothetical protein
MSPRRMQIQRMGVELAARLLACAWWKELRAYVRTQDELVIGAVGWIAQGCFT